MTHSLLFRARTFFVVLILVPLHLEMAAQTFEELNLRFNGYYNRKPLRSAAELEQNNWIAHDSMFSSRMDTFTVFVRDFSPYRDSTGELIYKQADEMPQFPGGWRKFVKENSQFFQEKAKNDDTPCVVWVTAVVEKDGALSDIKVLRPSNSPDDIFPNYPLFRKEAGRLVAAMNKGWAPAKHKGETVRCEKLFQIEFGN